MNERIKELWQQSKNPSWDGELGAANELNPEKFAELIVKECAGVCLEQRQYQPKEVYAQAVLSHFGVEQTASQKMAEAGYTRRPRGWTREDEE